MFSILNVWRTIQTTIFKRLIFHFSPIQVSFVPEFNKMPIESNLIFFTPVPLNKLFWIFFFGGDLWLFQSSEVLLVVLFFNIENLAQFNVKVSDSQPVPSFSSHQLQACFKLGSLRFEEGTSWTLTPVLAPFCEVSGSSPLRASPLLFPRSERGVLQWVT